MTVIHIHKKTIIPSHRITVGYVHVTVDKTDVLVELDCPGSRPDDEFRCTVAEAREILKQNERHMKTRGNFLCGVRGVTFRSYDLKDLVRALRKALPNVAPTR